MKYIEGKDLPCTRVTIQNRIRASQVASGEESAYQCRRYKRHGFDPWVRKIPWSRKQQPAPVFLSGKSHGQRSLEGYSPWGRKELDRTEHWAHTPIKIIKGLEPQRTLNNTPKINIINKKKITTGCYQKIPKIQEWITVIMNWWLIFLPVHFKWTLVACFVIMVCAC